MATTNSQQFRAFPIPPNELLSRSLIRFIHPGYPTDNELLSLPRVDRTPAGDFGVHHGTALLACQIIANNAFDTGRLTLDAAGQQSIDTPLDGILTQEKYCLLLAVSLYPIVPSFQDWQFPHGKIPDSWPRTLSPSHRASRCALTNFAGACEITHIVPKKELVWFQRNNMRQYITNRTAVCPIDDSCNTLPLRADLHRLFDDRQFVIVPKVAATEMPPQFVLHILCKGDIGECWPSYHNSLVQYLGTESLPLLFARFAWAVLLHARVFVVSGIRNVIRIHMRAADADGKQLAEWKVERCSEKQLMDCYGGGGSLGAMPITPTKKRRRTDSTLDDGEDSAESFGEDEYMGDAWDTAEEESGRKRRLQHSSDKTAPDFKPDLPADIEADLRVAVTGVVETVPLRDSEEEVEVDLAL